MNGLNRTTLLALLIALIASACTTIPEQLKGDYTTLDPESTGEGDLQTSVRWGGIILETRPEDDHTCFEILSKHLEKSMRPANTDKASGRFIACRPGFYDPEVFEKDREVTVTGKVIYLDSRKVGEYDYNYPIVDIDFISLWPKRRIRPYYNNWGPYNSFYWNYPGHGFYYGHYPFW